MTFFDSQWARFYIDDTGAVERNLTAFITELRGLPGKRQLADRSAFGDGGRRYIDGQEDVPFTISGIFDDTVTTGPDAVLGPLRTHEAPVDFRYRVFTNVAGTSAGYKEYAGTCLVQNYMLQTRVGSKVTWTATLIVTGAVQVRTSETTVYV